jgi:hypothetical protein
MCFCIYTPAQFEKMFAAAGMYKIQKNTCKTQTRLTRYYKDTADTSEDF